MKSVHCMCAHIIIQSFQNRRRYVIGCYRLARTTLHSRPHLIFILTAILLLATRAQADNAPDFKRDIRPILERSCLKCHSGAVAQGGVRLDSRDSAMSSHGSSGAVIIPHSAVQSGLIQRVSTPSEDLRMPPASSGLPRLTSAEITKLKAWIDAGPAWDITTSAAIAAASTNWSLKPLRRPAVPSRIGNPIDAFVRFQLAARKISPSPPAERKTLLRRLYYDLTGLPPRPQEAAAFVADKRPDSYERVVDRLLASPRYGERWARHWLDTIHYADSHGFEHDIGRDNGWPFRDYVITAYNTDTPWPRFIREQLAADYFYPDKPQLTPALGFLGAGTFDLSAYTTAPRNFALIDRDDLITQTMSAFVSTTANCARCHNHKFDPIPQADYYALQAVFAGIIKGDRLYETSPQVGAERKRCTDLISAADRRDAAVLLSPQNQALVDAYLARPEAKAVWQSAQVETALSAEGSTLTINQDGSISAGGKRPETDTYTNRLATSLHTVTALRLDVLASPNLPMHGPGRQDNGNLHLSEIEVQIEEPGAIAHKIKIVRATADFNQDGWGIERAIDGDPVTAWGIYPQVGKSHYALFTFAEKVQIGPNSRITVALRQLHGGGHLIGLYRLSLTNADPSTVSAVPLDVARALQTGAEERTADQRLTIAAYVLRERSTAEVAKLPAQGRVYAAGPSVDVPTLGMRSLAQPDPVFRLERGDIDKPKEEVAPGSLSAVAWLPSRFAIKERDSNNEAARRAALAEWIASPQNPLTWRSIVNRVWHYHFGKGICDTPGDFGKMGGKPSHPELLDWLAVWFRDDALGSLKKLHRLIVTSETYRQSSATRVGPSKVDSDNRLLWRFNRQRLDADSYRDFALSVSGNLDLTMGGPGVKHFTMRPGPQLTPALDYGAYDWNSAGSGRRSIYRTVWRGIADPFMESLDFPDLGLLAPARTFSVSALQGLELYNNGFVLHCSHLLADSVWQGAGAAAGKPRQTADAVTLAVRRVWLRNPTPAESAQMVRYADRYGLEALCRVLLNSNEFLFVE